METTRPLKEKKKAARLWLIVHSWLAKPEVRANQPTSGAVPLGDDAIFAAVEKAEPGVAVSFISRPVKSSRLMSS